MDAIARMTDDRSLSPGPPRDQPAADYAELLEVAAGQEQRFAEYTARRDAELTETLEAYRASIEEEPPSGPGPYPGRAGEPGWLHKGGIS